MSLSPVPEIVPVARLMIVTSTDVIGHGVVVDVVVRHRDIVRAPLNVESIVYIVRVVGRVGTVQINIADRNVMDEHPYGIAGRNDCCTSRRYTRFQQ